MNSLVKFDFIASTNICTQRDIEENRLDRRENCEMSRSSHAHRFISETSIP